jgi:RNA polymerase sigma factor (sigma-70 family)
VTDEHEASDAELLAAWRAGEETAGRALVRRHTTTLHRFLASKAPADVEDLAQATFLAVVESPDRFRGGSTFRTFLLAIARKILLKHYRKRMRGDRALALEKITAGDVSESPSFVAAVREELRLLVAALRRIPIDHQIALELHYWEGLSISGIAEVLDVPEGTVKSRLSRARDELRAQLEQITADPEVRARTLEDPERWASELRTLRLEELGPARRTDRQRP